MDPHRLSAGQSQRIQGQLSTEQTSTGRDTHNVLPETGAKKFEKKTITPPSWGEKFITGAKITGLGFVCGFLGVLAIGLFPVTALGVGLFKLGGSDIFDRGKDLDEFYYAANEIERNQNIGKTLETIGFVLAAPLFGCISFVGQIEKTLPLLEKPPQLSDKAQLAIRFAKSSIDRSGQMGDDLMKIEVDEIIFPLRERRDLEELFNHIFDYEIKNMSHQKGKEKFLDMINEKLRNL